MSARLDVHDLPEQEKEIARPYMDMVSLADFMKTKAEKDFGNKLDEEIAAREQLPTDSDWYYIQLIRNREYVIETMDKEAADPNSNLNKYAKYEYAFDYTFKSDINAVVTEFKRLSKLFVSILKDRLDDCDETNPTPKITQVVSMDNQLVYIVNSIDSIRGSLERLE